MTVNKKELKYLIIAVIFALALFTYVIPKVISAGFEDSSPYLQFGIFYLGIFVFLQIFLKAATLGRRINILGSIGVITLYMAMDTIVPPLMVSLKGELLSGPVLSASSPDYIFGLIAQQIGLTGIMVYLFTYILAPFILLIVAAKLIPNFVRSV